MGTGTSPCKNVGQVGFMMAIFALHWPWSLLSFTSPSALLIFNPRNRLAPRCTFQLSRHYYGAQLGLPAQFCSVQSKARRGRGQGKGCEIEGKKSSSKISVLLYFVCLGAVFPSVSDIPIICCCKQIDVSGYSNNSQGTHQG